MSDVFYNKPRSQKPHVTDESITFCWLGDGKYHYHCVSDSPLTEDMATYIQHVGFSRPCQGWGFERFKTKIVDGLFLSTWISWDNCE